MFWFLNFNEEKGASVLTNLQEKAQRGIFKWGLAGNYMYICFVPFDEKKLSIVPSMVYF